MGNDSLLNAWKSMQEPVPEVTTVWDSAWSFAAGSPEEGLEARVRPVAGAPVSLPHRVLKPDCPLWYSRIITLPGPGVLTVQADDGAQVYIGQMPLSRVGGTHFSCLDTGTVRVTVRVLNNAMAGGLRRVSYSTQAQYESYVKQRQGYTRCRRLIEKILLFQDADPAWRKSAAGMVKPGSPVDTVLEKMLKPFPLLIGPWLQRTGNNSMKISAASDDGSALTLQFGLDATLRQPLIRTLPSVAHFVLPELVPDTTYYYRLQAGKTISPVYSFRTGASDRFSFNVWADSQSGLEIFQKNMRNLSHTADAFGVGAGDLVNNGASEEEWISFLQTLSMHASTVPYYLLPGNHDYDGFYDNLRPALYEQYIQRERPHTYAWSYGNCAFITLDPNENFPVSIPDTTEQYRWFQQQIASEFWKRATWRFVFVHQPPLSQGWEGYHGEASVRALLEPVIESAGIDFVIAGHTHDYERLVKMYGRQKATFLVVGGAGGSLEPPPSSEQPEMDTVVKVHHVGRFHVDGNVIRFEARDVNNETIDLFTQSK